MLPDIHLDQSTFEELMEQAKNRIAGYYPEWTDFNYHDPGITMAELFAWLTEIQQYELNHIGDAHRQKYLKLLGAEIRHRSGAQAYVCAEVEQETYLPAGIRLGASGISFETEESQVLPGVSVSQCFGFLEKRLSYLDREQMSFGGPLEFFPFGREALAGTCLYIGFSGPLPKDRLLRLTVRTGGRKKVPRNPAAEGTIPLAKLSYSYWSGGYQPLEILRDETFGFLFDGQILFRLPRDMEKRRVDGEEGWYLRIRLEESQYDMPPVLSFLDVNLAKIRQKETEAVWVPASRGDKEKREIVAGHGLCICGKLRVFMEREGCFQEMPIEEQRLDEKTGEAHIRIKADEQEFETGAFWVLASSGSEWCERHQVLGRGRGFPDEVFFLDDEDVSYKELELLVEEAERPGVYRKWEKRQDFSHSGPEDYHYLVDGSQGRVLFGDCFHGRAPEGEILLISYARVLGEGGNVKANRIHAFLDGDWAQIPVSNPWDAHGGRDEESMDAAFSRVRRELLKAPNMVTEEDYEQAVLRTPGLRIESCRAIAGEGDHMVQIVVKPLSLQKRPRLTWALGQNIYRHLEPKRLLGTQIRLSSPVYIRIFVYLEAAVFPQYQEAEKLVEQETREYLSPLLTVFGGSVSYSGLYGHLDRLSCVAGVRSLVLDAKGNGVRRNTYGDLILPDSGIADEIEIQCSCSIVE